MELPVSLVNAGKHIWHSCGDCPVLLSYHWKRLDGSVAVYDGVRTGLQQPALDPGQTMKQKVSVVAPDEKGEFDLVMTLVQERVCWFEDKGFQPAVLRVSVL